MYYVYCSCLCTFLSLLYQSIAIFIARHTIEQSPAVFIDQPHQDKEDGDPAQDHHGVAEPEQGEVTRLK